MQNVTENDKTKSGTQRADEAEEREDQKKKEYDRNDNEHVSKTNTKGGGSVVPK